MNSMDKKLFINYGHEKSFVEKKFELPAGYQGDQKCLSVLFLATGNKELESKLLPYLDAKAASFRFPASFNLESLPVELSILVRLAIVLLNDEIQLNVNDFSALDEKNLTLALNAIKYRYTVNEQLYSIKGFSEDITH